MELKINGLDVSIGDVAVSELVRRHLASEAKLLFRSPPIAPYGVPLIGSQWKEHGGIYAGFARGVEGQPDYPLIVGEYPAQRLTWQAALKLEKDGWRVPNRRESALCFANVPELFEKTWHWTREQYEGDDGYAWAQNFDDGYQYDCHEDDEFRARLVRSVIVID